MDRHLDAEHPPPGPKEPAPGPIEIGVSSELFFGVRRILARRVKLPERPALNFEGLDVVDNPAENRVDVSVPGLSGDGSGGFVVGTAAGGWVTVRSNAFGFRVYKGGASGYALEVDNSAAEVRVGYALGVAGVVRLGDVAAVGAPAGGGALGAVGGALRVAQHAPPKITGSRSDPQGALKSLLAALANAGIIVDQTVA